VFELKKKIAIIDSHEYLVLPSKTEAMPQTLIEAMARGKIVVSSDTLGAKEIITDQKNGFLFKNGDSKGLEKILIHLEKMPNVKKAEISKNAISSSRRFGWNKLIKDLEDLF
ncbi:MAG: glycosyltransferase, partial [archaeon]